MKLIIGAKQLQKYMQLRGTYAGQIDGAIGPKSIAAAIELMQKEGVEMTASWAPERLMLAVAQLLFTDLGLSPGTIDGYWGPNTDRALEEYQNLMRNEPAEVEERAQQKTTWPTYSQMEKFYGPVGQNIEQYPCPYPMVLAWATDTKVSKISLNKKCAESALGCMEAAKDHYGVSGLEDLRLHLFGGSLNVRKMRGGDNWSVHSWAAAIDFDPEHNAFRTPWSNAAFSAPEYVKWWDIWEAAGWISLGRERGYDAMHVQACRL